jgi:hypothetical protein
MPTFPVIASARRARGNLFAVTTKRLLRFAPRNDAKKTHSEAAAGQPWQSHKIRTTGDCFALTSLGARNAHFSGHCERPNGAWQSPFCHSKEIASLRSQ